MTCYRFLIPILCVLSLFAAGLANAEASRPAKRDWIERWEVRYILYIDTAWSMQTTIRVGKDVNMERAKTKKSMYFDVEGMFQPLEIDAGESNKIAVVLLRFDESGRVRRSTAELNQFRGKRNVLNRLVLVKNPDSQETAYLLAYWIQDVPGLGTIAPAVCGAIDRYRYDDDWKTGTLSGDVGCREWTAQLYNPDRPYIDITSYGKEENLIGEIVGWSRFDDPPKPVIGQHGKTWLCLHECPGGEKPGVIKDIAAWARKHGFPMPVRPKKQPEFPNADLDWND